MKKYIKLLTISIGLSLIFVQNACQKAEIIEQNSSKPNVQQIEESFSKQSKLEGSPIRKKIEFALKTGNFRKEAPFKLNAESLFTNANARENAADRGCGKFKKITTSYPDEYDEFATVYYKANNLVDYIDFTYSDDPKFNSRLSYIYAGNTLTLSVKLNTGVVPLYEDVITLNANGFATSWLHDLTNYSYDNPYTERITYNSAGYPISFQEVYESKIVYDGQVKYTKENNFDTITDLVSGNVATYTNDLTRPAKITLSGAPFWINFFKLVGNDNTNDFTKIEIRDKSNKLTNTFEIKREFTSDGYPSKVTRIEDGKVAVIFKDITYDCKNYNVSQPRSYK